MEEEDLRDPQSNIQLLKGNTLFNDVSEEDLKRIEVLVTEKVYLPSEYIIREDSNEAHEFYLIKSGEVEILKRSSKADSDETYCVATLKTGDTIGEVALLEDVKRTATARALTKTKVLAIPIKDLRELSSLKEHYYRIIYHLNQVQAEMDEPPSFAKIALNLAKGLSERLNNTNLVTAEALRQELELSKLRVATGQFLIVVISTLVIYTYCLSVINSLIHFLPSTTIVAIPMMFVFSTVIIYFMVSTGYPAQFFGITLINWRQSVIEGFLWSILLMVLIVFLKWVYIQNVPYGYPLFEGPGTDIRNLSPFMTAMMILAYLIMTPLQELIARGAIQGSMQNFLTGKYRVFNAIIVSNLIFGMTHLHLSLRAGLAVLILGFFWGWLYARHKNLIGVSISHSLVGGWAFFVVGVQHILIV